MTKDDVQHKPTDLQIHQQIHQLKTPLGLKSMLKAKVCFSSDEKEFLSASSDRTSRCWSHGIVRESQVRGASMYTEACVSSLAAVFFQKKFARVACASCNSQIFAMLLKNSTSCMAVLHHVWTCLLCILAFWIALLSACTHRR